VPSPPPVADVERLLWGYIFKIALGDLTTAEALNGFFAEPCYVKHCAGESLSFFTITEEGGSEPQATSDTQSEVHGLADRCMYFISYDRYNTY
jgi:hypothetical protein